MTVNMEQGSIEREVYIEASPEIVFEVITTADHIKGWWQADEAVLDARPGGAGELVWGDRTDPAAHISPITVVDAVPPRLFSFRWVYTAGQVAAEGNSLLVTFEIAPSGTGSTLTMTETGFRERGWEAAVLEQCYNEHVEGWDRFVPRITAHVAALVASS
jgi:uncharacterized protein YndB with AHSA1/START domain